MGSRFGRTLLALALCVVSSLAVAQSRQLAPGFTTLPSQAVVVVAPLDVELFELGVGGVTEPKADWTADATRHMTDSLRRKASTLGLQARFMESRTADEHAELLHLHGAVARSISVHHMSGFMKLPTKEDRLDWSFADALRPLQQATGARYVLFTWVRDSYASAGRKAAMVGLAMLGIGVGGGIQQGYASLVDMETGQVLWFNQSISGMGDLRDEKSAEASMDRLLANFPGAPAK